MKQLKKAISLFLITAMMIGVLQISVSAEGEVQPLPHSYGDITIYLPDGVPQDIQDKIYAHFYGLVIPGDNQDNILCTLFGHKLTTTTTSVVRHNVYTNAPRCVEEIYDLSVCSRCDYVSQELLSSMRIFCH